MNTRWNFEAIGTKWVIDLDLPKNSPEKDLLEKVLSRIEDFDKTYSRFREDSLVYKISQSKGTYTFPKDSKKLFDTYQHFYNQTKGKMTPLIGKLLTEAGYDKDYSLNPKKMSTTPRWEDIMEWNYPTLTTKKEIELDFGACGKGYLIDIISTLLQKNQIEEYIVDAGGDMSHYSSKGHTIDVALENPLDPTQAIGVAPLSNESIAASAGNRRKWENFHHIIDPQDKKSPDHILALWVIADDTLTADALTTAIYFRDPYELTKNIKAEYLILKSDFSIQKSLNFPDSLFYNKN